MGVDLAKQVAVVSGGLGDIGRATALELARHGADIAICDVRPESDADALLGEFASMGRRGQYNRVDISDPVAVGSWLDDVRRRLGLPTIVIPNAAVVSVSPILNVDASVWRSELAVNLDGAFYLASIAARALLENGRAGRIVFVGSWAADHVHLQVPTYCVSKAAVRMLVKCLAGELASHRILVNEVAPGFVDAGLSAQLMKADPAVRELSRRQVPTGCLIAPREVARQIIHLCDPANCQMTGATLLMDGGLSVFGSGVMRQSPHISVSKA